MKPQDHVKTNNRPVQINQLINLFPDIDFISLIFCFLRHVCFSPAGGGGGSRYIPGWGGAARPHKP